jgi:uncharacterized membrane protein
MKRWFILVPFLLFGILWLRPLPALAGLHICNKTQSKLSVAVAVMSGDCDIDWCSERIQGWWNIEPGDCKTPIGAALDTSGDTDYYYYAEDSQGGTWTGSLPLCVDSQYEFDYNDREESACVSNTKKNFRRIKTENSSDYTLSLTP